MRLTRQPGLANRDCAAELSGLARLTCLLVSLGLAGLLCTASRLTPDQRGSGTHRQLGLPPCSVMMLYGTKCPACGMTTSWAWLMDGEPQMSAEINLGGFMLGLLAIAAIPLLAKMAWTGQSANQMTSWIFAIYWIIAMAVAMIQWLIRLIA